MGFGGGGGVRVSIIPSFWWGLGGGRYLLNPWMMICLIYIFALEPRRAQGSAYPFVRCGYEWSGVCIAGGGGCGSMEGPVGDNAFGV